MTKTKQIQKATLEALLARKQQAQAEKMQFVDIEVQKIGMSFTVQRQPLTRILSLLDRFADTEGLAEKFEMYKELIYNSVPLFQSKELQEAYAPAIPSDIVTMILNDDMTAIGQLGEGICALYGLDDGKAVDEIKN